MATLPYSRSGAAVTTGDHLVSDYTHPATGAPRSMRRDIGAQIFIWLGWAALAAFWGMSMTTFFGILNAVQSYPAPVQGGADFGGVAWLVIDFIGGLIILGLAIAFGSWMVARRDRRMDPVTERATAALYDTVEANGGEDLTTRSPETRKPTERDSYRG